jgi:hypothetical protein
MAIGPPQSGQAQPTTPPGIVSSAAARGAGRESGAIGSKLSPKSESRLGVAMRCFSLDDAFAAGRAESRRRNFLK